MRNPQTDVVVFESDEFSLECPVENGVAYDLPLGDDLAARISRELSTGFPEYKVSGTPVREDWGTVLYIQGQSRYWLNIHWAPLKGGSTNTWAIQFQEVRGCLSALFRRPRPAHLSCTPIMDVIASILAADPETFRSVRWLTDLEFSAEY